MPLVFVEIRASFVIDLAMARKVSEESAAIGVIEANVAIVGSKMMVIEGFYRN
jgi:hypothetical protein